MGGMYADDIFPIEHRKAVKKAFFCSLAICSFIRPGPM